MRLRKNSLDSREHVKARYRGSKGLIVLLLCIAFILVFVGVFLNSQASPRSNPTSFDCRSSSGAQTFSINAEVELSNGMDQNEAVNVATIALSKVLVINSEERIGSFGSSADLGRDGVWAVRLKWTRVTDSFFTGVHPGSTVPQTQMISGSFEAIVDPVNRTVVYSF